MMRLTFLLRSRYVDVLIFLSATVISILLLGYTGTDDSHISYFVADHLNSTLEIQNYSGQPVEQSSSPFFVCMLAAIKHFIFPRHLVSSFAPFVSVMAYILCFGFGLFFTRNQPAMRWPLLIAAVSSPLVYWSLSGMEASTYVLLLLVLIFAIESFPAVFLVLLISAILLTRPESLFVLLAAFGASLIIQFSKTRLLTFKPLVALVAASLLIFAIKHSLHLSFFPNPVYAKEGIALSRKLVGGLRYSVGTLLRVPVCIMAALASFWALGRHVLASRFSSRETLACTMVAALGVFPVLAGGDWMLFGRFYVAPVFFALLFGLPLLAKYVSNQGRLYAVLLIGCFCNTLTFALYAFGGIAVPYAQPVAIRYFQPSQIERYNRTHLRDVMFVDAAIAALRKAGIKNASLGSDQAGFVPYYLFLTTPHFNKFVDFRGLSSTEFVDRHISYRPIADNLRENRELLKQTHFVLPDFVFDLDDGSWSLLQRFTALGCREMVRQPLVLHDAPWHPDMKTNQFLVDCRGISL